MGTVRADNFSDGAGTGAPDFANGIKLSGGYDTTGGAGLASDTDPGIVAFFKTETKALDSGFTGGSVRFTRVGNIVTISGIDAYTHASGSTIATTGTFIPSDYRPTTLHRIAFGYINTGFIASTEITSSGQIVVFYFDNTLTLVAKTGQPAFSATYTIAP